MIRNYVKCALLLIFLQIVRGELNSLDNNVSNSSIRCPLYYWQCNNGECIRNEELCDGLIHCTDSSDETVVNCHLRECPKYAFQCAYGACITGSFKCNGIVDCVDGSDETMYLCNAGVNYMRDLQGNCKSKSFMNCKSGECIYNDKVCDGIKDCRDGSDETVETCSFLKCPEYSFRCGYGACIAGTAKCNGSVNCMDGSDEIPRICDTKIYDSQITTTILPITTRATPRPTTRATPIPTTRAPPRPPTTHRPQTSESSLYYCSANTLLNGYSSQASCSYDNSPISCFHSLLPGTIADITCAPGYIERKSHKDVNRIVCDSDGEWNYPKKKCKPDCGTLTAEQHEDPIKPWDVTIFKRSYTALFAPVCSGVIVSPKVVLTAGNCFLTLQDNYATDHVLYNVVEGVYQQSYSQGDLENGVHNVSRIIIQSSPKTEDLAILILVNYFQFSNNLKPICLPNVQSDINLITDNRFNVGRPVIRDTSKTYLEYLIAGVDRKHTSGSVANVNYVNIEFHLKFIKNEIKNYQHLL